MVVVVLVIIVTSMLLYHRPLAYQQASKQAQCVILFPGVVVVVKAVWEEGFPES